jgi:hypothetical protein
VPVVARVEHPRRRARRGHVPAILGAKAASLALAQSFSKSAPSLSYPCFLLLLPCASGKPSSSSSLPPAKSPAFATPFSNRRQPQLLHLPSYLPNPLDLSFAHCLTGNRGFPGRWPSMAIELHLDVELLAPATVFFVQQLKSNLGEVLMLMLSSFLRVPQFPCSFVALLPPLWYCSSRATCVPPAGCCTASHCHRPASPPARAVRRAAGHGHSPS